MIIEATWWIAGVEALHDEHASSAASNQPNRASDIAPGAALITPGTAPTTCPVSNVTAMPSTEPSTARPIVRAVLPGATRRAYRSRVSTRTTVTAPTDNRTRVSAGPE